MRTSIDTKELLFILFILLIFFPAFNIILFLFGCAPLYSLAMNNDKIFYDWKMVILIFAFISFMLLYIHTFLLTIVNKIPLIKSTAIIEKVTESTLKASLIFLLIAFGISPFISFFISGYVNSHYHPCSDNTGIFSAATYVKNGMMCSK